MDKITDNNYENWVNSDLKFKVWEYKPLTIGLWRPYNVEVGFIEDYIKRSVIETGDIILL
tara:strand:+ start:55 stop:234 length:180 start_codon:yes stop_codon:yes gene_type:complete